MSVAFRRESDDEHLEPRFALPIPPGPNPVTARGHAMIEARVVALEAALAAETDAARRTEIARDLAYWRARLATAAIAPVPTGDTVAFGSRVGFRLDGKDRALDIVGHDEADRDPARIAFSAPLARALIGATAGEWLPFAGREDAIELLSVAPIPG